MTSINSVLFLNLVMMECSKQCCVSQSFDTFLGDILFFCKSASWLNTVIAIMFSSSITSRISDTDDALASDDSLAMNAPATSSLTRPTVIENEAVEKKDSEIS